jgi:hypothetical protein
LDDQPPAVSSLTEISFTGKPPKQKTTKTFVMPTYPPIPPTISSSSLSGFRRKKHWLSFARRF